MGTVDLKQLAVEWHGSGRPKKVRGHIALSKASSAEDAVSEFLKANTAELHLGIDAGSLRLMHKVTTPIRTVLRYQQHIHDIPVFNSQVVVQLDHQQAVKQLEFGHVTDVKVNGDASAKRLDAAAAYSAALNSLGKVSLRKPDGVPSLVYFPTDQGLRLAYQVLILTDAPLHDWRVLVDAENGAVLSKVDIIKSVNGSGLVFDPNPVVTAQDNTLRQPTATVAGGCGYAGSPLASIDAQRVTRTLADLTLAGGVHSLDGPFAKIVNITAPVSTIPTEAVATDFAYSSSDERFGAVNLYYHIDTIQRYIQSLGITTANNRKTEADPAVSGFSAYYSPGNKSLHMGTSRPCHPDKSQEGDAILHEYGHAIQDNQVPGWGDPNPTTGRDETGAMGEGFGDILACVFFANAGNQFQRESFEDWAYVENGASALRRVDGTKVYPTDWASEVHDDGEIWSAALWNIYRAIGGDSLVEAERLAARDALLNTVIQSHHLLATNSSMPDGAEAVMTTHAELAAYRGKYLMQMLDSFHDRGLLKCDAAADLWMHDASSDLGSEPFAGPVFWESPDLWVRQVDDGGTSPQEPELGQDNYFYARVTNRGSVTARAFVVTFNVKPWAGVEFTYPDDLVPFVSAAVGFNLAPGASTIVKATWPAGMIPAKGTHACLLGQVYMPTDKSPPGSHVWDKNNLAQRNMTVVDAVPGDVVTAMFQLGSLHQRLPRIYDVEIVRPPGLPKLGVSIQASTPRETERLFKSIEHWKPEPHPQPASPAPSLKFVDFSSVEVSGDVLAPMRLRFAPGSSLDWGTAQPDHSKNHFETRASLVRTRCGLEIRFDDGKIAGFPVVLQPSAQLKCALKIHVPKDAPVGQVILLRLQQRLASGKLAGGISVEVHVKARG